jgi:hypothetical protein
MGNALARGVGPDGAGDAAVLEGVADGVGSGIGAVAVGVGSGRKDSDGIGAVGAGVEVAIDVGAGVGDAVGGAPVRYKISDPTMAASAYGAAATSVVVPAAMSLDQRSAPSAAR